MSVLSTVRNVWELAKTVERLLTLDQKHGEAIADIRLQFATIERRLDRLDDRVDRIADGAKAAARAGAQEAMTGTLVGLAQQVARLDERLATSERQRKLRDDG